MIRPDVIILDGPVRGLESTLVNERTPGGERPALNPAPSPEAPLPRAHAPIPDDPGPELATQSERQQTHHLGEARGPARVGGHHGWQPLGEDAT